jgi:hypothetical protein
LGIDTAPTGKYVTGITVTSGQILITFGNDANAAIATQTLQLRPGATPNDDVVWQCGSRVVGGSGITMTATDAAGGGTLEPKYRPSNCRG